MDSSRSPHRSRVGSPGGRPGFSGTSSLRLTHRPRENGYDRENMPDPSSNGADRINCYALVAYIPGILGSFFDQLRRDLEPNSLAPRAHLTILPPRGLATTVAPADAWAELQRKLLGFQPFSIAVGRAEVFPGTNVVYFSLQQGWDELQSLHRHLADGCLQFCEPFPYHPHITIAQKLTPEQALSIQQVAQRRWDEFYRGPREFSVESLSFVQNSSRDIWYDLAAIDLLDATPAR